MLVRPIEGDILAKLYGVYFLFCDFLDIRELIYNVERYISYCINIYRRKGL